MVREENKGEFFERLILKINNIIDSKGEFIMTIPMLYLEFEKEWNLNRIHQPLIAVSKFKITSNTNKLSKNNRHSATQCGMTVFL